MSFICWQFCLIDCFIECALHINVYLWGLTTNGKRNTFPCTSKKNLRHIFCHMTQKPFEYLLFISKQNMCIGITHTLNFLANLYVASFSNFWYAKKSFGAQKRTKNVSLKFNILCILIQIFVIFNHDNLVLISWNGKNDGQFLHTKY